MLQLSVLIPVHNVLVADLVNTLHIQAAENGYQIEIILLDDASKAEYLQQYRAFSSKSGIRVYFNNINQGRQFTRRRLAGLAGSDYLLFIDSDSSIISNDYLKRYLQCVFEEKQVVSGGRIYQKSPPQSCNLMLHWKYGSKREANVQHHQTSRPVKFHSNNFLIRKEIFINLNFPEIIKNYGHEDTYWGIIMQQNKIKIESISNAVLHNMVDTTDVFIEKSKMALNNLKILTKLADHQLLSKHVRLFSVYIWVTKMGISGLVFIVCKLIEKKIYSNLHSCNPSLLFFDLFRLNNFIQMMKSEEP